MTLFCDLSLFIIYFNLICRYFRFLTENVYREFAIRIWIIYLFNVEITKDSTEIKNLLRAKAKKNLLQLNKMTLHLRMTTVEHLFKGSE